MSVPELIKKVKKLPEFERVKNLHDAVHETLSQLERKNAIGTSYSRKRVKWVELKTKPWQGEEGPFSETKMVSETCRTPIRHPFERNLSKINGLYENWLQQPDRKVTMMRDPHVEASTITARPQARHRRASRDAEMTLPGSLVSRATRK
jgi:hypothetical protein